MSNPLKLTPLSFALSFSSIAFAHLEPIELKNDHSIVVTANRLAIRKESTLAHVSVITREDIERQQYHSLLDALRSIPSLAISNQGGVGKVSSISMRGTSNRHVLVLINGQKVGSATLGETAFEHFPISQIERIEVAHGAYSSLYGSEAIGGVIQIFTRDHTKSNEKNEKQIKVFGSTHIGSHQSYQGNLGLSASSPKTSATLNLATDFTHGFNATNIPQDNDLDKDGYRNRSLSLNVGYHTDRLIMKAHTLMIDAKNEYDYLDWGATDTPNVHSLIKQNVYGFDANINPITPWHINLQLGRSEDRLNSHDAYPSIINTQRDTISLQNHFTLPYQQILMFGFDYQQDKVSGSQNYAINKRDNKGYYIQYLSQFPLKVQSAIRLDDNEQFGHQTTGHITLGYDLNQAIHGYISYATAFKAPTFNDLYWPGSENPTLHPEQAKNYEIGFKGHTLFHSYWQVNAFQNNLDNMIVWAPDLQNQWRPSNVEKAEIKGVELNFGQNLNRLMWNISYTYQQAKNKTHNENLNKQLAFRPKQLAKMSMDYQLNDHWSTGLSLYANDKRYTNASNTHSLAGFATVDVNLNYRIDDECSVQAKISNLLDKNYQTNYGNNTLYYQDGRTAWLTFRYAMK